MSVCFCVECTSFLCDHVCVRVCVRVCVYVCEQEGRVFNIIVSILMYAQLQFIQSALQDNV